MHEVIYSPHFDFFIDKKERDGAHTMPSFHVHHKYEIYYEEKGTRRYYIEDSSYTVNPGDLILIGENEIHKTASIGDTPSSRIVINFSDDFLTDIHHTFPEIDFTSFLNHSGHLLTGLSNNEQYYIERTLNDLVNLYSSKDEAQLVETKLRFASLLLYIQRLVHQKSSESSHQDSTNPLIIDAQRYIVEHYTEDLTLQSVADALYISPYHLSRLFRKHVGFGIIEYAKNIRIKRAQELLVNGNDSITLVSEKSGFASVANFRRVFKEATGYTPQKYRQQFRKS